MASEALVCREHRRDLFVTTAEKKTASVYDKI